MFSLGFSFCEFGIAFSPTDTIKVWQAIVLSAWVIGPPIWFWAEYFFLYKPIPAGAAGKPSMDEYKHGVDVSSKIWLALVTALLALYFSKDLVK